MPEDRKILSRDETQRLVQELEELAATIEDCALSAPSEMEAEPLRKEAARYRSRVSELRGERPPRREF